MRIRCSSIETKIADIEGNLQKVKEKIKEAIKDEVDFLIFPEDVFTGKNCGNISNNKSFTKELEIWKEKIFCFLFEDLYFEKDILIAIKQNESFYFINKEIGIYNNEIFVESDFEPFGFSVKENGENKKYGIQIDLENNFMTLENEEVEKELKKIKSYLNNCLYISCANNSGESSTDFVLSSYKSICYNGKILSETNENELTFDFDEDLLKNEKANENSKIIKISSNPTFEIDKTPYIPKNKTKKEILERILDIQGKGLIQRMKSSGRDKIILGISGGLDSTVALLSCVNIFKKYNLPLKNIIGITMPGLGTTEKTYNNALNLMTCLGITSVTIDLRNILKETIKNLCLKEDDFGLTYQQTQSRERTQMLLDYANKEHGIVIGTGCMSEFALGWMTYGGDHLSMYAIAVGLPKTMVKYMANTFLENSENELKSVLLRIIDTPISPELAPINSNGEQNQKTEKIIGDYVLTDFFIYHFMKNNFGVKKIFNLATKCFENEFTKKEIYHSLETFVDRFFSRQYKKNCFGEGLQILDYSLSPRTFWKMPGDISNNLWKKELEEIKKEEDL